MVRHRHLTYLNVHETHTAVVHSTSTVEVFALLMSLWVAWSFLCFAISSVARRQRTLAPWLYLDEIDLANRR